MKSFEPAGRANDRTDIALAEPADAQGADDAVAGDRHPASAGPAPASAGPASLAAGSAPARRPDRRQPGRARRALTGIGRTLWRQLTSMRTALILLFLLAVGSLPAALLPQWYLNQSKTAQYIEAHPLLGPLLDHLGFFDVIASPWYSAIYLMLAISLVGCITPRSIELVRQWTARPGKAPRNLARLPHHAQVTVAGGVPETAERIRVALRHRGLGGWRTAVRTEPSGAVTVSAERGYLREVGNLVFHVAVLGLLFTMAIGSLFGYTGSVLVTEGDGFCSSAPVAYDNFAPGRLVDGTDMSPFCINVEKFEAAYDDDGMARYYRAQLGVQVGAQAGTAHFTQQMLNVNEPLRLDGQRLYLLGHGYVPQFTVRYPDGQTRQYSAPFEPKDAQFTSDGVIKITDPPVSAAAGSTGDDGPAKDQLAIVGVFAPSGIVTNGVLTSGYPELLNPMVSVEVYRGDLGLDQGSPQSVFAIDTTQVDKGLLVLQDRASLDLHQSVTLADGTVITFSGVKNFVSLQTSYDPVQGFALVFAILLIGGILTSLTIKRRRVWYRITPAAGSPQPVEREGLRLESVVDVGGLARTDQAGYGGEFDSLVALAGAPDPGVKELVP